MYQIDLNGQLTRKNLRSSNSAVILHSLHWQSQAISSSISPLILDGQRNGSYSDFGYEVWKDSRIYPKRIRENYVLRFRCLLDSAAPGNVLYTWLTIPETNQILYRKPWAAMELTGEVVTEEFTFYTGENFVIHGGMIGLSATSACEIYEPSLYLKKDG